MLENNPRLRLELQLDRWEFVKLNKFLTSSANWLEVPGQMIEQAAGQDLDEKQEIELSAQPFAKIVSQSPWEKNQYWDKVTVVVEFVTAIDTVIPYKNLATPMIYLSALLRSLDLFPDEMQVVQEVG